LGLVAPPNSLYCVHKSLSTSSAQAANLRRSASPWVSPLTQLDEAGEASIRHRKLLPLCHSIRSGAGELVSPDNQRWILVPILNFLQNRLQVISDGLLALVRILNLNDIQHHRVGEVGLTWLTVELVDGIRWHSGKLRVLPSGSNRHIYLHRPHLREGQAGLA
jgi:hypothetical protein